MLKYFYEEKEMRNEKDYINSRVIKEFFKKRMCEKTDAYISYLGRDKQALADTLKEIYSYHNSEWSNSFKIGEQNIRIGYIPKKSGVEINTGGRYVDKKLWIRYFLNWKEAAEVVAFLIENNEYIPGRDFSKECYKNAESVFKQLSLF